MVVDEFLTDTAREADIVLPAKTLFEQTDVIGAYWHAYLQLKQKVDRAAGRGEARDRDLPAAGRAARASRARRCARELPGPSDAEVEAWLAAKLRAVDPSITLDRLREGPVRAPGARGRGLRRPPLPDAVRPDRAALARRPRARWGVDPLPTCDGAGRVGRAARPATRCTSSRRTPRTASTRSSATCPRSARSTPSPVRPPRPGGRGARAACAAATACASSTTAASCVLPRAPRPRPAARRRRRAATAGGCHEGGAVNVLSKARETDMGYGAAFHENLVEVEKA